MSHTKMVLDLIKKNRDLLAQLKQEKAVGAKHLADWNSLEKQVVSLEEQLNISKQLNESGREGYARIKGELATALRDLSIMEERLRLFIGHLGEVIGTPLINPQFDNIDRLLGLVLGTALKGLETYARHNSGDGGPTKPLQYRPESVDTQRASNRPERFWENKTT